MCCSEGFDEESPLVESRGAYPDGPANGGENDFSEDPMLPPAAMRLPHEGVSHGMLIVM